MRKKWMLIIMLFAIVLVAVGCGKSDKFEPASINEGVDVCEVCNMLVEDNQHATQLILNSGRVLKFDDLGDLFVWTDKNGLNDVNVRYVRDYNTAEWIELEEAHFAYDASFHTPMGFGVYSFKNKQEAEDFIADQQVGVLLSASDLNHHAWESTMDHGDHDHGDHDHGDHGDHDEHDDHDEQDEHD